MLGADGGVNCGFYVSLFRPFVLPQLVVSNTQAASVYPIALCLYGNWLAETHLETPTVIMNKYLQEVTWGRWGGGGNLGKLGRRG